MNDWLSGIADNELLQGYLRGFAQWAGQATGPLLVFIFGGQWVKNALGLKDVERQRDKSIGASLAVDQVRTIDPASFHSRLKDAYCGPKSLPQLKRDGTLPDLADEFQHLQRQVAGDKKCAAYVEAAREFFVKCFDRPNRNKSKELRGLLDEASKALPQGGLSNKDWEALKDPCPTNSLFEWFVHPLR